MIFVIQRSIDKRNLTIFDHWALRTERYGIPLLRQNAATTSEPGNQFGSWSGIEFTIPSDASIELDFNEQFDSIAAYNISDHFGREFDEVQDSVLTVIQSNIESGYVGPTDNDKLVELCSKLKTHKEILTEARERLRDFI
jgi:hypothetical protein